LTIAPQFIDGLLREVHPMIVLPTEKPLMYTTIGEGHSYLFIVPYYLLYKILRDKYIKEVF